MPITAIYAPPEVHVAGSDVFQADMNWLNKFAAPRGVNINEKLKVVGRDATKQRHWPIGGSFDLSRCQIHAVPLGADVLGIETEPVYQVLREMFNNAPEYLDEVGLYMPVEQPLLTAAGAHIPEDWAWHEDAWWRPARRGEDARELAFRVKNTTEQEFDASASLSVVHTASRDVSNSFSAGISTTVGVEVGAEGGGFSAKVSTSTTVSFEYNRTESAGQSVSQEISSASGLTVKLLPGERRQTVFTDELGRARFRIKENVFYKGMIGIMWDHDVDFHAGGRGRLLWVDAGQALGLDGLNVEEEYTVGHYAAGTISLEAPAETS